MPIGRTLPVALLGVQVPSTFSLPQEGIRRVQLQGILENLEHVLMRTLLADGAFGHEQPLPYPIKEIIQVYNDE